jgi:hypothetical protein
MAWETTLEGFPDTMWGSVPGGYDVMSDLVPTDDGGVVAGGYSIPGGSWPNGDPQMATVYRLDATGREIWRSYLGAGTDDYEVRRIRRTPDGGFVVACTAWTPFQTGDGGMFYNTSFVAKLDGAGNEVWRRPIDRLRLDLLADADVLPDGSVVGAGRAWVSGGGTVTALAKISASGSLLWIRTADPGNVDGDRRVAAAADGGLFAVQGRYGASLSRYSADGTLLWDVPVAGVDGAEWLYDKTFHGITPLADGGCVLAGAAREGNGSWYGPTRPFLATFDARGRQTGTLVVDTASLANHAVERLPDGGLLSVEGTDGFGPTPVYVRYDARGNELWRSAYGTMGRDLYVSAVRATADGGFAAAGSVPSPGALYLPRDGYVLMLEGAAPPETPVPGGALRIDVLPGSPDNPVNPRSRGLLPVALLSADGFDAAAINPAAVTLEGVTAVSGGRGTIKAERKDVDGDGRTDLLLFFSIPTLGLSPSTSSVTLRATTPDEVTWTATEPVRIVGAK